jgi:hypothetical protein
MHQAAFFLIALIFQGRGHELSAFAMGWDIGLAFRSLQRSQRFQRQQAEMRKLSCE